MFRTCAVVIAILLAAACSAPMQQESRVEVVTAGPAILAIEAIGSLHSSQATPLIVPGEWSQRRLIWLIPDGSTVHQGEVIARFAADTDQFELDMALLDVERASRERATQNMELHDRSSELDVSQADVVGQLAITRRYTGATDGVLARNTVLEAVQDQGYLLRKERVLTDMQRLLSRRGGQAMALLDAKEATFEEQVRRRRAVLSQLEVRAPHDGIVVFEADGAGQKPHLDATLWAGTKFATLPNLQAMEIDIAVPQMDATAIHEGLGVEIHPVDVPQDKIETRISWVAATAAQRDRDSPARYLSVRAPVSAAEIASRRWQPNQSFVARIYLLRSGHAICVPNVAIGRAGDRNFVNVRGRGGVSARVVHVGVRGPSRSEIVAGLNAGDAVELAPAGPPDAVVDAAGSGSSARSGVRQ
ncbi:MAG: efflux RND transporter periplasmic adaptor subunit [Rudaea sp.]|uniref:efflux RND transporter periplasmic adaptor subunit n=1 Tax=Rudaea sp. 3F27F6 TaxID=2502208 RepID=UPI0010F645AC|nr:efflux RND transporter periplasmic adaptor subunit [Rudaea sp. 3F27F6]MBR0346001.1 efflux RND transporter periplasmic adaptor subunit [Rudaea sp.]